MFDRITSVASLTLLLLVAPGTPSGGTCIGDCDSSGGVSVDDLVVMANLAAQSTGTSGCPSGDADRNGFITVDEIIRAVSNALHGCGPMPTPTTEPTPGQLMVGAAKRDISPSTANAPPLGTVNLGGYGFGPGRRSTGILNRIYVRAFVISDGQHTFAFADSETQGAFVAYKRGPFGLSDMARAVETATTGRIPRQHVVISSCHSHAGPDTTGVWGGLPNVYMQFLADQTVGAITDALAALQPAQLLTGTTDATDLLHSQFDAPPNDRVDGELRVLVAADPTDATRLRTVLINFAAHATVMGSDNRLVSSDWPGVVATKIEQSLGVDTAVVMVADVGRTQPNRADGATDPDKLESYAAQVAARVLDAASHVTASQPGPLAAAQLFLREPYANPVAAFSLLTSIIGRASSPPWLDGMVIGTMVSALRVGDLFFAAVPGEAYPAIQFALRDRVPAARHFIFGLANDQLGYLIAPQEGYPEVLAASPGNDNALFNVSPLVGDHVMCTLFKAARQSGYTLADDPDTCARWAAEDNRLP